ncbi:MAG TPA: glycoside hydrolase, partial [Thermoanaerobaculia bacterium]
TLVDNFRERPEDPELLRRVHEAVTLARSAPFQVDLWRAQNRCYELLQTVYPEQLEKAEKGDEAAAEWVSRFKKLGEGLAVRVG